MASEGPSLPASQKKHVKLHEIAVKLNREKPPIGKKHHYIFISYKICTERNFKKKTTPSKKPSMLFSQLPGFGHHATAFACLWGDDDLAAAKSGDIKAKKYLHKTPTK